MLTDVERVRQMPVVSFIGSFIFTVIVIVGLLVTAALICFLCFFNRARCVSDKSSRSYPASPKAHGSRSESAGARQATPCSATTRNPWDFRSDEPIHAEVIEVRDVTPQGQH